MDQHDYSVPCGPFELKLSVWDCCFPPMYSKRLLCFSLSDEHCQTNRQQIINNLHEALRLTVKQVPWLGGTVSPISGTAWRYEVVPRGAAVLDIKDYSTSLSYEKLKATDFSCAVLDAKDLCPLPNAVYPSDAPAFRIRASFIDGGLILTFQISHILCDGFGIMQILQKFSENFCLAQNGSCGQVEEDTEYNFDRRSVLCSSGTLEDASHTPTWTTAPIPSLPMHPSQRTVCASYRIKTAGLRLLKTTVAPLNEVTGKRSTHDAVAALIWRTLMFARFQAGIIPASRTVHLTTAVDCRAKLGLPVPYYGNAIYAARPALPLELLLYGNTKRPEEGTDKRDRDSEHQAGLPGLQAAARAIRDAIDSITGDTFRAVLAGVERTETQVRTRLAGIEDFAAGSLLLISWFRYQAHDLWFGDKPGVGLGRIGAYRLPSNYINPGSPTVLPRLPAKDGEEGECEFVFNEPEAVTECMGRDELFNQFVERTS